MYNRTSISKSIGLQSQSVSIPSLEKVTQVIQKAKEGSESAAKEVFRYYRFCPSPTSPEEVKVINTVYDAFQELFK